MYIVPFRKVGIEVSEAEGDDEYVATTYTVMAWLLFWLVAGGMALYGVLLLAAWALRALGVVITGVPNA